MGKFIITALSMSAVFFCTVTLTTHHRIERNIRAQMDGIMERADATPYRLSVRMFDGCGSFWGYSFTTTHRMKADLDGRPQFMVAQFCSDFRGRPHLVSVSTVVFPNA